MQRLEQADSYLRRFRSQVTATEPHPDGLWVQLAASAFYPTSGGQPHDTGTLAGFPVGNVELRQGAVWHQLQRTPDADPASRVQPGDEVEGEIDWPRRYRHMQRHSGQHLLSQAFMRVAPGFPTRSVGLSSADCTLDVAGEPDAAQLDAVERLANEVAYQNLPITAFEVDEAELLRYALRRPPKVRGRIRLVQMGDFELAACGGTHLRTTAEAAPIKLLRSERIRGGLTRIYFRVGLDALDDYALKHRVAYGLAVSFSAKPGELPERVAALRDELAAARQQLTTLRRRMAAALADELLRKAAAAESAAAESAAGTAVRLVVHQLEPDDAELLSFLAEAFQRRPRVVALLGAALPDKAQLLFTRSNDVAIDVSALLKSALPQIEGRGGGRPDRAQGAGGRVAGLRDALAAAARQASTLLRAD